MKNRRGWDVLHGSYDSGSQISVMRAGIVNDISDYGEIRIGITSAYGEHGILNYFNIDENKW